MYIALHAVFTTALQPCLSALSVWGVANLLAGPGARSTSPHDRPRPNRPLISGIIIAASIVVAAGIAIYESPQVRAWVDQSRRKIAVALHNLGDDIQPRRASESSDDFDARKRRRDELIRHNRNELIRRAREEGVAVDLDELARIGDEDIGLAERRSRADRSKSFDTLVGTDGLLKTTGNDASDNTLRKRGAAGFAAGSMSMADPFADETVLFDVGDDEDAPSPQEFTYTEPTTTRESTATLDAQSPPLIDLTSDIPAPDETEAAAQSFYSVASHTQDTLTQPSLAHTQFFDDEAASHMSTGTLTPRSERSHSIVAADDVDILSMQNDTDHDARSESDFTEGGFSEFGGNDGIMTPSSWTDVGSDDGSEWGGVGNGHVSQVQQ
jgi:hypothetical protein